MELPFAGLHQLCAPMLAPARRAPRAAAGRAARRASACRRADAPDRFLVGAGRAQPAGRGRRGAAAALPRRRRAVARRRVGPGARVRRPAAAGRVGADRVRRPRADERARARRPARAAARRPRRRRRARAPGAVVPGRLDDRVRDRIVAETRGNPLALLELPQGMSAAELAGGFALPGAGDLPGQIEEHYLRRLGDAAGGDAAADAAGRGRPRRGRDARLARGRAARDRPARRAGPARGEQLLEIGAPGPLPPSARAVGGLSGARRCPSAGRCTWRWPRRRDPQVDPDRRAWHRAAAASGPDEGGRRRARAIRRASPDRAAGSPPRPRSSSASVALTPGPGAPRTARALAAARANLHAGAFGCGARAAGRRGGRAARRAPARSGGAAPRPDRVGVRRGERRPGAAAEGRQAARAARRGPGPRDVPRRVGRRDVRRPPGPAGRQPARRLAGGEGRPARSSPARSVRPAARRARRADHGGARAPPHRRCGGRCRRSAATRRPSSNGSSGACWPRRPRSTPLGLRELERGEHPPDRARPRAPGRWPRCRSRSTAKR